MASQITETIGLRSFELVRDQIGAILADEMPSQSTLNSDTRLNSEVFVERFRPVSDEEVKDKSIIVVELSQGDYDMKTIKSQDGTYVFNIDCYEFGSSTATTRGDKTASIRLQRLLGVVQGILSHPAYVMLGFQAPFIEHTEVSGFKISDPTGKKDTSAMVMGRIEFKVRVPDKLNGSTPVPIDGYTTQALLGLTALGYTYGTQTLPPVPPVCADVEIKLNGIFIVNAESGAFIDIPVKDALGVVVGSWNGSEFIVPASMPDDYDITINGATFETINSNTDIAVKDTGGVSVGSKVGSEWIVPAVPTLDIIYFRPQRSGQTTIYATYDDAWKTANNVDTYSPGAGIPAILDPTDIRLLVNNNLHGHKFRWVGINGGYWNHLTVRWEDINGDLTTEALAQPEDYLEDHHTGLGIINSVIDGTVVRNWAQSMAVPNTVTNSGFSDFYPFTLHEYFSILQFDISTQLVRNPFNKLTVSVWFLSTNHRGSATTTYYVQQTITLSTISRTNSYPNTVVAMRYALPR